ncbi:unnamed protein product [Caenorhabditis angaria]|uniref:G-protein coupled receptors family 1 profile domain-containing protein n=1 Tax=Caenorhabditis angaria TaxID=860376 RepID=A0A9P1IUR7_9PELO|nr:unnamed protein product [Caenorhabditis angaria]
MVLDASWNETTLQNGHKGVTLVHVAAISMGAVNCTLNGLIWIAFRRSPQLLTKHHLHLFYIFAITNFLTGFFTIPTYVNLFWHNNLECPRWTILIGASFEIALDKIRHLITLSIAGERIYALFRPGDYFFLDHRIFAYKVCLISIVWGVFDAIFLIFEDNLFVVRMHCVTTAASAKYFHFYFLISTIIFGIILSIAYFFFICKLFVIRGTRIINTKSRCRDNFHQVNSLTVMVILMVVLFNVLPSMLYLYDMIIQQVHFMQWGPIITIGYHCYGCASFFFYNCRHHEIRNALNKIRLIRRFLNCDKSPTTSKCDVSGQYSNIKPAKNNTPAIITTSRITNAESDNEVFL